jgi:hypothetical protein
MSGRSKKYVSAVEIRIATGHEVAMKRNFQ